MSVSPSATLATQNARTCSKLCVSKLCVCVEVVCVCVRELCVCVSKLCVCVSE